LKGCNDNSTDNAESIWKTILVRE